MADGRLAGKAAIVTGGASGIGRAVAQRFVAEGARVLAVDVNGAGLEETIGMVKAAGGTLHGAVADVSRGDDARGVVAQAMQDFGAVHLLANMHGVSEFSDTNILGVSEEVFTRTWEVNVKALFLLCKAALPELERSGGGAIVNMSSGAALGGGGGTAYTASKGGVNALTRAVAYQFAAKNIRCNAICPGPIDTPMMHRSFEKLGMTNLPIAPGRVPRIGRPEEVAALVTFLCSDEAAFITAATYTIDGGATGH
ncbi:MAG TPA: SDR family oxidoreductase [Dehalococcoidia bacterium]|nr:SDR family oxidoreductase [Dehalococcoidia bacterium]